MSILSIVVGVFLLCFFFIGLIPIIISVYRISQLNSRPEQVEYDIRMRAERKARTRGKRLAIQYNPVGYQFYSRTGYQTQQQTQYMYNTGSQPVVAKFEYCPSCGSKVEEGYRYCPKCRAELH